MVEKYAAEQGRTVQGDQFPDRGFFYRSDQFNLAKIGVPAVYLDTGTDFVDRPVAEQDEMPSWNPGDEFEAARQQALAALGGVGQN